MDLFRFFMIFIFKYLQMWVCCFLTYRLPMQAAISPMFCMVFMMFFFIVILVTSKVE